jgi:transposase-like protein
MPSGCIIDLSSVIETSKICWLNAESMSVLRQYDCGATSSGHDMPEAIHHKSQYANNSAELSHQPTGVRERGIRKFKSIEQGQ